MKTAAQTTKNALKGISRYTACKVIFDFTDVTIVGDNKTISPSEINSITNANQILNKNRDRAIKLATFEKDKFKLDGSYQIPSQNYIENGEQGWWSSNICNEEGIFSNSPVITIQFDNIHSMPALTITFDILENEYATDFEIKAYNSIDEIVENKHITNNTKAQIMIAGNFYLLKKVDIKINKWCKPYRYAKIVEVDFGVLKTYTDNELIKVNVIEEINLLNENLPANELQFTIDNSSNEFNILNPDNAYKFLQERQQATIYFGVEVNGTINYFKSGTFYLQEWKAESNGLSFTFIARSIIDLLSKYDYENLISQTTNIYNVIVNILQTAHITDYVIDSSLQSISTLGLIQKTTCRDALLMALQAGKAYCYTDIDGKIHIVKDTTNINTPIDNIELSNMYSEPEIQLSKAIKQVEVSYYTDLNTQNSITIDNNLIDKGDVYKLENNTLINTEQHATDVANWLLKWLKYRAIYNINWRQNFLLDLLDIVSIENRFNQRNAVIYKQEYEYQGYLMGMTEARGDINVLA